MKRTFTIAFFIFLFQSTLHAQLTRTSEDILAMRETKQGKYRLETTAVMDAVALNMSYGNAEIISEKDRKIIRNQEVLQVDLVFTDFPKGIDLQTLNLERINKIKAIRPDLVSNPEIHWRVIRQMACKNEAEAKVLFHGVVIHYRHKQTEEERLAEEKKLFSFLPEESELKSPSSIRKSLADSSIIKILERNKDWKEMTVVADFTGSMWPYTSQVVLWFKLHEKEKRVNDIVFFNDGDGTPDNKKIIGKTGGIYHSICENYETVRKIALETISNGCGGDGPENDIEAILKAIEKAPKTKDFVLIADNWAPIKDISLMDKVNKPIHVILCGAQFGVNVQYMNLALKTGGSIHTMEQDLTDLISKKEGETFVFNGKMYKIVGGNIVEHTPILKS